MRNTDTSQRLPGIIRARRTAAPLTLAQLAALSGVSQSHLSRIERGDRFPSAGILRKIAKPLGFTQRELLILAGYMSPEPSVLRKEREEYGVGRLDIRVAKMVAQEPIKVQRALVSLLPILKSIAQQIAEADVDETEPDAT